MNNLTALFAITTLAATAGIAQARDLGPDEALKLRDAGTIQSFDKLNAAALAKHPGGQVTETELEEEYGRYIYQVEVRDYKVRIVNVDVKGGVSEDNSGKTSGNESRNESD